MPILLGTWGCGGVQFRVQPQLMPIKQISGWAVEASVVPVTAATPPKVKASAAGQAHHAATTLPCRLPTIRNRSCPTVAAQVGRAHYEHIPRILQGLPRGLRRAGTHIVGIGSDAEGLQWRWNPPQKKGVPRSERHEGFPRTKCKSKIIVLAAGVVVSPFLVSRYFALSRAGVPLDWMLYLGLPLTGAAAPVDAPVPAGRRSRRR